MLKNASCGFRGIINRISYDNFPTSQAHGNDQISIRATHSLNDPITMKLVGYQEDSNMIKDPFAAETSKVELVSSHCVASSASHRGRGLHAVRLATARFGPLARSL